jgi:hypothetical protein
MSERMPPAEPALPVAPRQWWWRRRPPVDHTRFARGVWWAGHVQLVVAAGLLLVCLPLFAVGLAAPPPADAVPPGPGTFWMRVETVWIPLLGVAMSGPFVLSGLMLRTNSEWGLYRRPQTVGGRLLRVAGLAGTVVGIAVVSILITVFLVYLLFHVAALAFGLA